MSVPACAPRSSDLSDCDLFVGIDVDKRSMAVTFVDHNVLKQSHKMPASAQNLLNHLSRHYPGRRAALAYEAGPTGYGLYDALNAAGLRCMVVAPQLVPQPRGARVKTNRIDSVRLATALRSADIESIRVPEGVYRDMRHLVSLRNQHARQVQSTMYRIKALLLMQGLQFPSAPAGSQWSRRVVGELRQLECSATLRFHLDSLLDSLQFARQQKLRAHQQIRRLLREHADLGDSVRYLRSIPGVGWVIAYNVLARVGDWRNLRNVRELGAFIGVVPCENSTGDRTERGNITRSGDAKLRSMLIEGAWAAIRKDAELREFFNRICKRHPRDRAAKVAIVAVARKLTHRMYAVLTERREYTAERPAKTDAASSASEQSVELTHKTDRLAASDPETTAGGQARSRGHACRFEEPRARGTGARLVGSHAIEGQGPAVNSAIGPAKMDNRST